MNILKPYNVNSILNNLKSVFKNKDISELNRSGYNFLYLMSGFIAHYNLNGFQRNYSDLRDLIADLKNSSDYNDPEREVRDPYFAEQYGEEYPKSKVAILKGIKEIVEQYEDKIQNYFSKEEKNGEINEARRLAKKHGLKVN